MMVLTECHVVSQCECIFDEMVNVVESARTCVYHVAVALDLDSYDGRLLRAYEEALDRGVRVFLCTSGALYKNNCSRLSTNKSHNLNLFENVTLKNDVLGNTLTGQFLKRVAYPFSNDACFRGQHVRFCCNDDTMILSGGNADMDKYYGSCEIYQNIMYEKALVLKNFTVQTPMSFVKKLFHTIATSAPFKTLYRHCPEHIFINGKRTHDWICENIRSAKSEIYIENQYTVSYENVSWGGYMESTENKIMKRLAERINRAIETKRKFRLTYVCNEFFPDEKGLPNATLNVLFVVSLRYLRSQVRCDDIEFRKYVRILVPKKHVNVLIHSKLWVFDRKVIMCTSGNIMDRSFSDDFGDMEMSWVLNSKTCSPTCISKTYQAIRTSVPRNLTCVYEDVIDRNYHVDFTKNILRNISSLIENTLHVDCRLVVGIKQQIIR